MTTYAFCAPILPGKTDVGKELTTLLRGDYKSDAERLRREAGLDREQVFIQSTPMGDVAIVVWDTENFDKVVDVFAKDGSDFGKWFRSKLMEIHGFDISDVANAPKLEIGYEWTDTSWSFGDFEAGTVCFPLKPGMTDTILSWAKELSGPRNGDFVRTRGELGIKRQLFILQRTPQGDFAIMYGEGKPNWLAGGYEVNSTSTEPFFVWFRESLQALSAAPLFAGGPAPKLERIFEMTVRTPVKA